VGIDFCFEVEFFAEFYLEETVEVLSDGFDGVVADLDFFF